MLSTVFISKYVVIYVSKMYFEIKTRDISRLNFKMCVVRA